MEGEDPYQTFAPPTYEAGELLGNNDATCHVTFFTNYILFIIRQLFVVLICIHHLHDHLWHQLSPFQACAEHLLPVISPK